MSNHPFTPDFQRIARVPLLAEFPLETTADVIHLESSSHAWPCLRMGIRGVPMSHLDVVVDGRLLIEDAFDSDPTGDRVVVIEAGLQRGKLDGAVRNRLSLRTIDRRSAAAAPWSTPGTKTRPAVLRGRTWPGRTELEVVAGDHLAWGVSFRVMHERLEPENAGKVVLWHLGKFFGHLPEDQKEEARLIANALQLWCHLPTVPARLTARGELVDWVRPMFCPGAGVCDCPTKMTLAAANRAAERALYGLSRQAGYRKLTIKERIRLGLGADAPLWHTVDGLLPRYAAMGLPMPMWARTGAGEYTSTGGASEVAELYRRRRDEDDGIE